MNKHETGIFKKSCKIFKDGILEIVNIHKDIVKSIKTKESNDNQTSNSSSISNDGTGVSDDPIKNR